MSLPPKTLMKEATPPQNKDSDNSVTSDEYDCDTLLSSVFGQVVTVMLEYLDIQTLLRFACTSKHNHFLVEYEINRRKKLVSINKAEMARLLQPALTSNLRMHLPRRDLFGRAFSLQQQSLALIDSGIDPCCIHPLHGHVCNCHRDSRFRVERQELMHHKNCQYDKDVDMPMLPIIFYISSIDNYSFIAPIMYLCWLISVQDEVQKRKVMVEMSNLIWDLLSLGTHAQDSSGGSLDTIEFRHCAQQMADYCFKMGQIESFRITACIVIQHNQSIMHRVLDIYQYALMEMDKILVDFSSHVLKMYNVLDEMESQVVVK